MSNGQERRYWEKIFDLTYKDKINTWDMHGLHLHGIIVNYQLYHQ